MCFVWISEQTAIISPYNINWLVFVTETESVYCAVRTECLKVIQAKCPCEFIVDKVTLEQGFLQVLLFPPVSITPSNSTILFPLSVSLHQYSTILFPLSVSPHQYSTLLFPLSILLYKYSTLLFPPVSITLQILHTSVSPVNITPPIPHTHLHLATTLIRKTSGRILGSFKIHTFS
jgi:hypothetical protein